MEQDSSIEKETALLPTQRHEDWVESQTDLSLPIISPNGVITPKDIKNAMQASTASFTVKAMELLGDKSVMQAGGDYLAQILTIYSNLAHSNNMDETVAAVQSTITTIKGDDYQALVHASITGMLVLGTALVTRDELVAVGRSIKHRTEKRVKRVLQKRNNNATK